MAMIYTRGADWHFKLEDVSNPLLPSLMPLDPPTPSTPKRSKSPLSMVKKEEPRPIDTASNVVEAVPSTDSFDYSLYPQPQELWDTPRSTVHVAVTESSPIAPNQWGCTETYDRVLEEQGDLNKSDSPGMSDMFEITTKYTYLSQRELFTRYPSPSHEYLKDNARLRRLALQRCALRAIAEKEQEIFESKQVVLARQRELIQMHEELVSRGLEV